MMFAEVLVVLDGEAAGERIVGWVRRLCRPTGARVRLLVVRDVEETVWWGPRPVAFATQLEDMARLESLAYLEGVAARLESAGVRVSTEVRFGPAVETVLGAARDSGATLLALTTSGHTGRPSRLDRLARELPHRAPIAVLVARARNQRAA